MKRVVFTLVAIFFMGVSAFASNADLFKLDYNAVQQEFTELNVLADMVEANPDMTYSTLAVTDAGLVESMSLVPTAAMPLAGGDAVLGIPSFWWGCALGIVGVGVVYFLTDQDADEAKKALWGCVAGTVVGTILYFVLIIGAFGAAATAG